MTRSQSPLMICARASSITGDQHDNATRGMGWGKGGLDGRRHTTLFPPFHHLTCVTSRFRFPPKFRLMSCKGHF